MREVVATDVKILAETNPSNLALESIKTQMRLGLKNVRLKLEGEPLTIRMLRVSHYEQTREAWSSPPFYYDTGYKMCLSVSLESERAMEDQYSVQLGWMGSSVRHATGTGAWTYASVSLLLLKGEFDDQLTWPYPAKGSEISIQLQSDMHPGIHVFYGWHSHQQSQGSHQQRQAIYSVCSRCARLKLQRVSDGEGSQVVGVQRINNNDQTNKHHDSIVLKVSVDRHSCLR